MTQRMLVLAMFAGLAGLAGCATTPPPSRADAPPVHPASPIPDMQITYTCKSGRTVLALYQTQKATVRFDGQTHPMSIAASNRDSRYVGDKLEWWTTGTAAGDQGTLYVHDNDGRTGAVLDSCVVPFGEGQ